MQGEVKCCKGLRKAPIGKGAYGPVKKGPLQGCFKCGGDHYQQDCQQNWASARSLCPADGGDADAGVRSLCYCIQERVTKLATCPTPMSLLSPRGGDVCISQCSHPDLTEERQGQLENKKKWTEVVSKRTKRKRSQCQRRQTVLDPIDEGLGESEVKAPEDNKSTEHVNTLKTVMPEGVNGIGATE